MRSLAEAKVNELCTITDILNMHDGADVRLCELGMTPNQKIRVVAKSLFKKVCLVEIRGYNLSVRTSLLKDVIIK